MRLKEGAAHDERQYRRTETMRSALRSHAAQPGVTADEPEACIPRCAACRPGVRLGPGARARCARPGVAGPAIARDHSLPARGHRRRDRAADLRPACATPRSAAGRRQSRRGKRPGRARAGRARATRRLHDQRRPGGQRRGRAAHHTRAGLRPAARLRPDRAGRAQPPRARGASVHALPQRARADQLGQGESWQAHLRIER